MSRAVWDPQAYERLPLPHERWGAGVIARAGLSAGESLVDAGCGTGRDAELALGILLEQCRDRGVAAGRVTLLDADPAMVTWARERFAALPEELRPVVRLADLTDPWPVDEPAQVVISVAALHWIEDHQAVFRRAAAACVPGGRLHVDCGGAGNIADILEAASGVGLAVPAWNFAGVDDTVSALRAAGWEPGDVWLQDDPLVLPDMAALREFVRTVMFHQASPEQLDRVIGACAEPRVGYVRLNIDARRI